jgi:Zinc carboxypeptidase/Immune inhibitor A-like, MAM domain/Dockerin type I domain
MYQSGGQMQISKIVSIVIIIILLFTASSFSAESHKSQAKIYFDSKEMLVKLRLMHLDVIEYGEGYFEVIIAPEQMEEIQAQGYNAEVIHEDLTLFYQSRLDPDKSMGGYHTFSEIEAYIDSLVLGHPDIVSSKLSIGLTIEGRNIWAIKISDNPNIDEDETEVLFTAAMHAREVITPLVLRNFAEHLTDNYGIDSDVDYLVDNREIWMIFCVNPDGYYHNEFTDPNGGGMWRKNRRDNGDFTYGVDLNRNYGYQWGYDNEGSSPYTDDQTYRGTGPFSEPETQAMRDFHIAHEFDVSVYYHSKSNLNIWPWGYDYLYTPDEDLFSIIGDSMTAYNNYEPGTVWEAINYIANGASDDWIYAEQILKNKTFALTVEVGNSTDGWWPPLYRIPELCGENLGAMMVAARIAGNVYSLRPPKSPTMTVPDSVLDGEDFTIAWQLIDTDNPAVEYELVELTDHQTITDFADNFDYCLNNEFTVSSARSYSAPSSFYSGEQNSIYHYVEYEMPFMIRTGDTLSFMTWYDIENNWDYAYVEVATDGMAFETIEGNITTNYNPNGSNRGNGITGTSSGWEEALFNLSQFAGEIITIRLSYNTDSYTLEEGIYFDDIYPIDIFGSESVISIPSADTTYLMPGKTENVYYYKVHGKDAEDQWGAFSNTKPTIVFLPETYICGDANRDDLINVSDAVHIVNYIFVVDSPAPNPIASGDVNCDSVVNVSDAVWIINYIFVSGNAPCDTDGDLIPDC